MLVEMMLKRHFREWCVAIVLGLLLLVLWVRAPGFFRKEQVLSTLGTALPVLVVGCGVSLVIICRQIDISVGSQFAVCSIVLGLLVQQHWPLGAAAGAVIILGALLGAFNGAMVAGFGLPSIVVTLATMVTWREALRWWRQGEFVHDLPESFQWFGLSQLSGQGTILSVSAAVFLAFVWSTRHLSAGRYFFAVGSDAEAARLAGIRAQAVTFWAFVLTGGLAGLASLLNAVRFVDVDPKTGSGLELQTIAAAVVGGVAISGGRGSLWGLLAGVLLLSCIAPALVFLHLPAQWEKALQGAIILLAVGVDGLRRAIKRG